MEVFSFGLGFAYVGGGVDMLTYYNWEQYLAIRCYLPGV